MKYSKTYVLALLLFFSVPAQACYLDVVAFLSMASICIISKLTENKEAAARGVVEYWNQRLKNCMMAHINACHYGNADAIRHSQQLYDSAYREKCLAEQQLSLILASKKS